MARAASIKVTLGIRNWYLDIGSNWAFGNTKFTAVTCFSDFQQCFPRAQFPMPKPTFIETVLFMCGARFVFKRNDLKRWRNDVHLVVHCKPSS